VAPYGQSPETGCQQRDIPNGCSGDLVYEDAHASLMVALTEINGATVSAATFDNVRNFQEQPGPDRIPTS
jgi:hypothetical protein